MYMPFPVSSIETKTGVQQVLAINLHGTHFPNPTTGAWDEAFRDPDGVLMINFYLWLMAAADAALITVYIETIPDYELMTSGAVTITRFYRLLIPLTEGDARAITMHMASMLAEKTVTERGGKRQRSGSVDQSNFVERTASGAKVKEHSMVNTNLDYKQVDSEGVFLQAFATLTGGRLQYQSEIDYTCPPMSTDTNRPPGGAADDDSDADDDDGDEGDDGMVGNRFQDWQNMCPSNNVLKMLDAKVHFLTGLKAYPGIHADQCNFALYFEDGKFQFPDIVYDNNLLIEIRPTAPFIGKNPNNLIGNFLLPAATMWRMTAEELLAKIEKCADMNGDEVPEEFYGMPVDELRTAWKESTKLNQDYSYFSPITTDPAETHMSEAATDSDRHLAVIYPRMGAMANQISEEHLKMVEALGSGKITEKTMTLWRTDVVRRILRFWGGQEQTGFVRSYFGLRVECVALEMRMKRRRDAVTNEARRYRKITKRFGMDEVNSRVALCADLLRGPMHLTPPQTAATWYMWITSHSTYKPEIGGLQPTFILSGPPGSGKSKSMDVMHSMLPGQSRVVSDMTSTKAITANARLGVHKIDEWKIGVHHNGDEVYHLTYMSTGMLDYERFELDTNRSGGSGNVHIKSDQRKMTISASNNLVTKRVRERCQLICISGTKIDGAAGTEEHATLVNELPDVQAAVLFFQSVFASHTEIYLVQQFLRTKIDKSYLPLWYSLATNVMGKEFAPHSRQITSLDFVASGVMMFRLVTEYDNISSYESGAQTFVDYFLANSLVSMYDYTFAFEMMTKNTSMTLEESSVLCALKGSIVLKETGEDLAMTAGGYYITNLKTTPEVMARCSGKMSQAGGLVDSVMEKLTSSNGKGVEPVVISISKRADPNFGHYAIHKTFAAPATLEHLLPAQKAILEFLEKDVIGEVTDGDVPAMWYVSYDEEWVVFHKNVHSRLLRPFMGGKRFAKAPTLLAARLSQDHLKQGMLLLEAAGLVKYRVPDAHPDDLDGEACSVSSYAAGPKAVRVKRAGPLDPGSILPDYTKVDDAVSLDAVWRRTQADLIGCSSCPGPIPWKVPLTVTNCIMVNMSVLRTAVENKERARCGARIVSSANNGKSSRFGELWDAAMAVSGEYVPGDIICQGQNPQSKEKFETHTIVKHGTDSIRIRNPRYREGSIADENGDVSASSTGAFLLPAKDRFIDLPCFDPESDNVSLSNTIRQRIAAANGVPANFVRGARVTEENVD